MDQTRLHRWRLSTLTASIGAIVCLAVSGYSAVRVERPAGVGDIKVHIDITLPGLVLFMAGIALLVLAFKLRANPAPKDEA